MKIVADDKIPYLKGVLEPQAEVEYLPGGAISNNDVKDADALIVRTRTKCDKALLQGSSVQFIATATIGFDHIDREYCREHNIRWTNAPGCNASSVMQYIASALANLNRVRPDLPEKPTIGIVGVGNVGTKVEKLAGLLDMNVMLNDPPRERNEGGHHWSSLEEIIDKADLISLHVPLNPSGRDKTHHLFDANLLARLNRETVLINSSRGEVVNNDALKQALSSHQITTAILDVWENEPGINRELLEMATLGTPHIAGYSRDGKANGTAQSVRAVSKSFGFGIENWYPGNIEPPENPLVKINASGKSHREIIYKAITATYDIAEDDSRLRNLPENFEQLRGNYPVRREFQAYRLELTGETDPQTIQKLENLAFQVTHKTTNN